MEALLDELIKSGTEISRVCPCKPEASFVLNESTDDIDQSSSLILRENYSTASLKEKSIVPTELRRGSIQSPNVSLAQRSLPNLTEP